jgi:hypothetical protein
MHDGAGGAWGAACGWCRWGSSCVGLRWVACAWAYGVGQRTLRSPPCIHPATATLHYLSLDHHNLALHIITAFTGRHTPFPVTQATNYTNADLPALDTLLNGTVVKVPGRGWSARKEEIAVLLQRCATSKLVLCSMLMLTSNRTSMHTATLCC